MLIAPDLELTFIEVRSVLPDPARVTSPFAKMFPVGVMLVPPDIVMVPLVAVNEPAPE